MDVNEDLDCNSIDYDWSDLPSVALLEVYSKLSLEDRLSASSSCRLWRPLVFQAPLVNQLDLYIQSAEKEGEKIGFLTEHVVGKVSRLNLTFNGGNMDVLDLVGDIMEQLEGNRSLTALKIRCTEDSVAKDLFYDCSTSAVIRRKYFTRKVLMPLLRVLQNKNCLDTFSFPLIHELVHFESSFLSNLGRSTKLHSLQNLFLSTLRTPLLLRNNGFGGEALLPSTHLSLRNINAFVNLQMLGVDHDVVNDDILGKLGAGSASGGLVRLNLVAVQPNEDISNKGWSSFVANNPNCKVRLTVTGSGVLFEHKSNLLFPSIPLTHFRAIYCKGIRMAALNSLVLWNENSLEHLELIDENFDWMDYIVQPDDLNQNQFLDPIIYAAWRCSKLHTIKIGFLYCGQSLVGIARLKGPKLSCLEISKSQVIYHNMQQLSNEVSKALTRPWKPVDDIMERRKFRSQSASKRLIHILRTATTDEN